MTTKNKESECITIEQYIRVKSSGIHNRGVFARTDIPKSTRLIEYKGKKITKEEGNRILDETYERHLKDPKNHAGTYIFELNDTWDLDGDIPNNDAKYINHSCEPNCKMSIEGDHIWIDTVRDIKKDEEITYNYGFDLNENDLYDFEGQKCLCGSKKCVGYILNEDEWPKMKELIDKKRKEKHN